MSVLNKELDPNVSVKKKTNYSSLHYESVFKEVLITVFI